MPNQALIQEVQRLDVIHTSWRDYALLLMNSTNDPLRSIWREKVVTSFVHWTFGKGSISEENLLGMEILSELPTSFTKRIVDDAFSPEGDGSWHKLKRLPRGKRMEVHIGHYPQESMSNEAFQCVKYIIDHFDQYGQLIDNSPTLHAMWVMAQMSDGACVTGDEILTYVLELPINDAKHSNVVDVCLNVFSRGIPSDKYKKYWRSDRIEGFPKNTASDASEIFNIVWDPSDPNYDSNAKEAAIQSIIANWEPSKDLTPQRAAENFIKFCSVILKEDVAWSPCWKKIAICILKNDVTFKYAGFAATLRERQAREDAFDAFDQQKKAQEEAKRQALAQARAIEERNKE